MKVLIIDDEADIRRVVQLALSRVGGMEVVTASGGAEGVEKARSEAPDAILLDVMMPEMDGPATLERLVAAGIVPGTPVIFLTAKPMGAEAEGLRALGARGVLAKPFDPMDLSRQLLEALSG